MERKLNLGCGFDKRKGYLNIDLNSFHNPDLVADIRKLDMLPSDYFEEILAQDVLEHLERRDILPTLVEWARLLSIGGRLILRIPNLMGLFLLFLERETPKDHDELIHCLFGTQAYNGDYHLAGFTDILIKDYLNKSNFKIISMKPKDIWLLDIIAQKI